MPEPTTPPPPAHEPLWVSRVVHAEPRVPLMGPYMAYLVLMLLIDFFPKDDFWRHAAIVIHMIGAGWATWIVRHHWPALGRPHVILAVIVGLFSAWMWVAGQHWLETIQVAGTNLGGSLGLKSSFPFVTVEAIDPAAIKNVAADFSSPASFWTHVVLKITRAVTLVPIVEELFWRGFLLQAFISWDRFETVPIGRFSWFAFLGTSFLSVAQHPANWGVSIACWLLFNALFYRTRSLLCLMITHGVTNLALYVYVVRSGDWQFW